MESNLDSKRIIKKINREKIKKVEVDEYSYLGIVELDKIKVVKTTKQ